MLDRPCVEFVQSQRLPWERNGHDLARPDVAYKMLSHDASDGACSVLVRYPPAYSSKGPEHLLAAEEFYVLEGSLRMNGRTYAADSYAYLPAGWTRRDTESSDGCVMLAFYDCNPVRVAGSGTGTCETCAVPYLDASRQAWDMTVNDPKLRHLGISRKNLRTDPETGERTFLSLVLPQSSPAGGAGPQEMHPVVEEAFVLAGALTGPHGTMHAGAYFWRPPHVPHGPFGSRWGSVSLIRFVGGAHVNIWTDEEVPFRADAPYDPVLPAGLAHLAHAPWAEAAAY